jgi:hypothetical protein
MRIRMLGHAGAAARRCSPLGRRVWCIERCYRVGCKVINNNLCDEIAMKLQHAQKQTFVFFSFFSTSRLSIELSDRELLSSDM